LTSPWPISYMSRNFGNWITISCFLANFLLRMRRNGQNTASGQIFKAKFEIAMGCFLFEYEFWWSFRQDLYVLCAKNCFRNAKFSEFGDIERGGKNFLSKPQKVHPCLISRVFRYRSCKSVHGFLLQTSARKKGTLRKVTERLYFTYLRGIPHPTKFNQNWHTSMDRRRNQSHQVR